MPCNTITPSNDKSRSSDLHTQRGRRLHTIKITTASLIAVAAFIVFVATDVHKSRVYISKMKTIRTKIDLNIDTTDLVHALQVERAAAVLTHYSFKESSVLSPRLDIAQKETNEMLERMTISEFSIDEEKVILESKQKLQKYIDEFRSKFDANRSADDAIVFYSGVIKGMLSRLTDVTAQVDQSVRLLLGYEFVSKAEEYTSLKIVYGALFFLSGNFTSLQTKEFYGAKKLAEAYRNKSSLFLPETEMIFNQKMATLTTTNDELQEMENAVITNKTLSDSMSNVTKWFELTAKQQHILSVVQDSVAKTLKQSISYKLEIHTCRIIKLLSVVVVVISLIPLLTSSLSKTIQTIRSYVSQTSKLEVELFEQKKKTENLVEDHMPRSVARTLQTEGNYKARKLDSVTIAFIGIVDFEDIIELCDPENIPSFFKSVDERLQDCLRRYNVYKIQSAHTSWMVISGAPEPNGIRHVDEIAQFSLDAKEDIRDLKLFGQCTSLRIGIHTGPVIAGVYGEDTPKYCVLGSAVTLASCVMKHGEGMAISIL